MLLFHVCEPNIYSSQPPSRWLRSSHWQHWEAVALCVFLYVCECVLYIVDVCIRILVGPRGLPWFLSSLFFYYFFHLLSLCVCLGVHSCCAHVELREKPCGADSLPPCENRSADFDCWVTITFTCEPSSRPSYLVFFETDPLSEPRGQASGLQGSACPWLSTPEITNAPWCLAFPLRYL